MRILADVFSGHVKTQGAKFYFSWHRDYQIIPDPSLCHQLVRMDHLENAFASNGGKVWGLLRTSHTTSHPTCLEQNSFRARRLFESESLEELKVFKAFECFLAAHKQNLVNM